jgi:hypothetical protein
MALSTTSVQVRSVQVRTITGYRTTTIASLFNSLVLMANSENGPKVKVIGSGRSVKTGKTVKLNGEYTVVGGESVRGRNGSSELTLRDSKGSEFLLNWKEDSIEDIEPVGIVPTPTTARKRATA